MFFAFPHWKRSEKHHQQQNSPHQKIMEVTPHRMKSMQLVSSSYLRHEKSGSAGSSAARQGLEFHITSWWSHFCFIVHLLETNYVVCTLYCATYPTHIKQCPFLSRGFSWISIMSCKTSKKYPNVQFYSHYRSAASSHPSVQSVSALWISMKNNTFFKRNLGNQRPNFHSCGLTEVALLRQGWSGNEFEAWL